MDIIFEIVDKTGRKIRLTKKQNSHINKKHPAIAIYINEIKETLQKPDAITKSETDENVRFYYKYYKYLISPHKYILVIVKYLNGDGFIITALFEKNIK
jgi:hypothetical protein